MCSLSMSGNFCSRSEMRPCRKHGQKKADHFQRKSVSFSSPNVSHADSRVLTQVPQSPPHTWPQRPSFQSSGLSTCGSPSAGCSASEGADSATADGSCFAGDSAAGAVAAGDGAGGAEAVAGAGGASDAILLMLSVAMSVIRG